MVYQGYRIHSQEPLQDTYKRVIIEQLRLSDDLCMNYNNEPDTATHEIRKSIKRIRAVCRLYQHGIDTTDYQQIQERYRKISSLLAEHRIAAVHCSTLGLIGQKGSFPDPGWFALLLSDLQTRHSRLTAVFLEQKVPDAVQVLLLEAVKALENQSVVVRNIKELGMGLRNSYKEGRHLLEITRQGPTAENFHELRKCVKNLWNQLILFRSLWPPVMGLSIYHLDVLAERLGNEHDLAELGIYLDKVRNPNDSNFENLFRLLEIKRLQVQKSLFPLASRLFAEKPGTFTSRILAYYKIFSQQS